MLIYTMLLLFLCIELVHMYSTNIRYGPFMQKQINANGKIVT